MMILALALAATPLPARDRISEADLAGHIRILASDEFEGRKPGTVASGKTLSYIATAWARAGLRPGAVDGSWFQPVALVESGPDSAALRLNGRNVIAIVPGDIIAVGSAPSQDLTDALLVEVGPGDQVPPGIKGRVAVLRIAATPKPGYLLRRHREALFSAGAAAVLLLAPGEQAWAQAKTQTGQLGTTLGPRPGTDLIMEAGRYDAMRVAAGGEAPTLSGRVLSRIRKYTSHNVVAKLPGTGTGADGEAVAIIGHWDHLGICRPEGAPDRICNGAVDNASGIAVMIEVAERLAAGKRSQRDIVFVATTAEESGLLGANAYVEAPTVPLAKIVGLLNIDTIAIGPRGLPVSAVNRGNTAIDPLIDEAARAQGRPLDQDLDANGFINRQDGAAFTRAGVPAVMAGGSFADMTKLQAFLGGAYHGPEDEFSDAMPLDGAAEDAELHVLLARAMADPKRYRKKP